MIENPKINPDKIWFPMEIFESSIHRYGVRSLARIPAKRFVIEYTGVLLNRRQHKELPVTQESHTYIWQISSYWSIDGVKNGSGAEIINHSCDPNLRVWFKGKQVYYISRRRIAKGEELTIDYNYEASDESIPCHCGSPLCRGTINRLPKR